MQVLLLKEHCKACESMLDRKGLHLKKQRTQRSTAECLGMKSKLQLIDTAELEPRLSLPSLPVAAMMNDSSLRQALDCLSVCLSYKCFG